MFKFLSIALLACFAVQAAASLPVISVKGSKFFAGGQQFFLKGVAYQGTPADPLVDTNQCQLDAKAMQAIGTNSIRVYHVNPYSNHDGCMAAFSAAGIYIWLDLDTFNTTIVQTTPQWTQEQFFNFAKVMDVFEGYDNLGGFWIGNEVINNLSGSPSAPYIKAATADMKSYMVAKKYRNIPIGYSAADIVELRPMLQNYLACGDHLDQSIDFFGLNSYEWCGAATYDTSGYSNLQAMSQGYSIPIFFSETGCNVGGDRTFQDQNAIFGPDMIGTWSGSIIYEWVEETNHYGLVNYHNGQIYSGAPIPIQPDYNNLQNVWRNINLSGVAEGSYTPNFSAPACPMASAGWAVNGNVPLPTLAPNVIAVAVANQKPSPVATTSSMMPASASAPSSSTISTSSSTSVSPFSSISTSASPSVTSSSSIASSTSFASMETSASGGSLEPSATPLPHPYPTRFAPFPHIVHSIDFKSAHDERESKLAAARSSSSASALSSIAAGRASASASLTANTDNAASTTAPAPSASTSHSGAVSMRSLPYSLPSVETFLNDTLQKVVLDQKISVPLFSLIFNIWSLIYLAGFLS